MKKTTSLLMAGLLAVSMLNAAAFADGGLTSSMAGNDVEQGEFTSEHPVLARVSTAPFRLATGAAGMGIGVVAGTAKGLVLGFQEANEWAHVVHPNETRGDAAEAFARNLLYLPTVALGSVVLIPKNIVQYGLTTGWEFGGKGSTWWERI